MRIGFIISYVAPYIRPVLERLAERDDCDLFVVAETVMEPDRRWQPQVDLPFRHCVLDSWTLDLAPVAVGAEAKTRFDTYVYLPKHPLRALRKFGPDVVVAAGSGIWSSPANIAALAARFRADWGFVPYWGSFRRPRPTLPRRLAEPWVKTFMRSADAWLAYGTRSARDLVELGADPTRIAIAPLVALPTLEGGSDPSPSEAAGRPACLYVGRLIERKGVEVLLEAFRYMEGCELWLVGDGPMRERIEALTATNPLIRLFGHLDQEALARLYRQASVVAVPSLYEPWGLVVDEALAHRTPVVATDQVGAADDLIDDGVNGLIVPAGSSRALGEAIRRIVAWTAEQRRLGAQHSRLKLQSQSVDRAVGGIVEGCALAVERRRRLAGSSQ